MDEIDARQWLDAAIVSRETRARLDAFAELLMAANLHQNLVSTASIEKIYARHIVDSAQLWRLVPDAKCWLDLGSGAGLPGLIIAILTQAPVVLVESRRLRTEWLRYATQTLGLTNVQIEASRIENVQSFTAAAITARAFAPLPKLFALAHRFSLPKTRWILPKGRTAPEELASVALAWHGEFEVLKSVTDSDSAIIIAHDVRPRGVRR